MTLQIVVAAVIGEAHIAEVAFGCEGTHLAACHRSITPAVMEENRLLVC